MTTDKTPTDAEILEVVNAAPALETAEAEWLHVCRAVLAKWGTSQPTHAQTGAVPLTDEQIDQAIAELGLNYLADAHATNRAVLRKLCHHAHDIKGGKHGADT